MNDPRNPQEPPQGASVWGSQAPLDPMGSQMVPPTLSRPQQHLHVHSAPPAGVAGSTAKGVGQGLGIGFGLMIAAAAIVIGVPVVLCMGVFGVASIGAGIAGKATKEAAAADASAWKSAAPLAKIGGVSVAFAEGLVGRPSLTDLRGREGRSETERLVIRVRVENSTTTKKVDFTTWGSTDTDLLGRDKGTLQDEHGNTYKRISPAFGERWTGQVASQSIAPGAAIFDLLVFEAPIPAATTLRLSLPAENADEKGVFRLAIPASRIAGGK